MAVSLLDFANQFQSPFQTGIVRKWLNEGLFVRILNFLPCDGFSYTYGEEASAGGIYYRALNEDYPAGEYSVVNPRTETMPIFGAEIKTDVQAVEKQGGAARANEIARRMRRAALFFDKEVIKGDGAKNAKAITGLYARLTGNQVFYAGDNGDKLTLAMVDDLLDRVYGKNEQKILVMNKACRRKLKELVVASAGGAAVSDVGGSLDKYDGATIEVLDEDGDENPILDFDETRGSSNLTTSILCVHPGSTTDKEGLQGLVGNGGIKRYDQGIKGTAYGDLVEAHMGIALFNARAAARLAGVLKG